MLLKRLLIFLFLFCFGFTSFQPVKAQVGEGMKQPRLLVMIDESSSMIEPWLKGKERYKAATDIIMALYDSVYAVNPAIEFALRAFGEQYNIKDHNCYDTKQEVGYSRHNRTQLQLRLEDLHPLGTTPIAYSLQKAADEDLLEDYKYFYSLVLITDGGESCGGDICEIARKLRERKIQFKPYIISLVNDAKLPGEYDCLGNYLQVTTEADIPKAVGTIVESYRPMLNMIKSDFKKLQSSMVATPSILKVEVPNVKITKEVPDTIIVKAPKEVPKPVPVPEPKPEPKVEPKPEPKPARVKEDIALLPIKKIYAPKRMTAYISPVTRDLKIPHIPLPAPNPPKEDITILPKKPKVETPPKPKEPSEKLVSYVLQTAESADTKLEVYFTDGKGKFYKTTPEIILTEPNTDKEVKRFIRAIDNNGLPIAQKVQDGTFNLRIGGGKIPLIARSVPIPPHKTSKLTVVVSSGSLHFAYEGKPDKPVSEFSAWVTERVIGGNGPQVTQKCDLDLEYETGTYHISINTTPKTERYVDVEFGNVTVITIDEPGFLQITNTAPLGHVELFMPKNDNYVKFLELQVNGDQVAQRVRMQPGLYEARYKGAGPGDVKRVKFNVKSTQTTELELEK